MKKLQVLLLFALTLAACNTEKENVTIKGKILNNKNGEMLYSSILDETCNGWFKDSVTPDSSGLFTITLKIDQPCFISLSTNSSYKQIIIEPEETYEIEIGEEQIKLINQISDAQLYYENLPASHPNGYGFFPVDVSGYDSIYDSLNNKLENELLELRKVNCSEDVRNLISADRQVYYNFAISSLASRKKMASYRNNETTPIDVMKMWENAVPDTFLTDIATKKSTYYFDLLGMAFWYNLYTKLDYDSLKVIRKEKREQGLIHTYNIELAKKLLPHEIIEYYTATYIQSKAKQTKFEKEFIALFNQFKTDYPNSKYIEYINPSIEKIVDFHDKIKVEFNEEYKFVDNYENISSLKDCLIPFKGKKMYVDIWSTSCGPCKKEFEFNEKLKETLKNKGVEMLYISLDGDRTKSRWKDMVKYYSLKGNHIRANEKLIADLREKLGGFGIPRYLIINKQGDIVNSDAPRPSNLPELEKQL